MWYAIGCFVSCVTFTLVLKVLEGAWFIQRLHDHGKIVNATFVGHVSWAALGAINCPEDGRKIVGVKWLPDEQSKKCDALSVLMTRSEKVTRFLTFLVERKNVHTLSFQWNSDRAKNELFNSKGQPKLLKLGTKFRVFDFGHVYYGHVRDVILDKHDVMWVQGSFPKATDVRVLHLLVLHKKYALRI